MKPVRYYAPPKQLHVKGEIAPHGTPTRYVQHKCRCEACREAICQKEAASRRRRGYGLTSDWEDSLVDATEARRYLKQLDRMGVPFNRMEELTGVGHTALWQIKSGRRKRIFPATADAILGVSWSDYLENGRPNNRVDAAETHRLIGEILAAGFTKVFVAHHLGQTGPGLQLAKDTVTLRHARAVQELHDRLWRENAEGYRGHRNAPGGRIYSGIRMRDTCRCRLAEEPEAIANREAKRRERSRRAAA